LQNRLYTKLNLIFATVACMKQVMMVAISILIIGGFIYWSSDFKDGVDKSDLIRVEIPEVGQIITSPVTIKGMARGTLFFEASFPIVLVD